MHRLFFEALGTSWSILIDQDGSLSESIEAEIALIVRTFEQKYSRFIPESLVSQYNQGKKITTTAEFEALLAFGKTLEAHTDGYFSVFVGKYLGELGYGKELQHLDFGAFGKGWLVDLISEYLLKQNISNFLINAGGDIFATKKADGTAWNVGLEHPTRPELSIGTVELCNQALAASSPFKRQWEYNKEQQHHLINPHTQQPTTLQRAVFVIAATAKVADALATALSIIQEENCAQLARLYNSEYLIIDSTKVLTSPGFYPPLPKRAPF